MQPDLRLGTCAATVANRIGSTAVLEYRPTETIPPLGAMLPSPASLPTTLPADSSHTRGNPGFALEQTRNPERGGLSAGGNWIRTSSSASGGHRFRAPRRPSGRLGLAGVSEEAIAICN